MVENNYIREGKSYPIGGLVNGEIDGLIITKGEIVDIYDIFLSDGKVSISNLYSLVTLEEESWHTTRAQLLKVGMRVVHVDNSIAEIKNIEIRKGREIKIPKGLIGLNTYLVAQ